jgi:hypothetical protein
MKRRARTQSAPLRYVAWALDRAEAPQGDLATEVAPPGLLRFALMFTQRRIIVNTRRLPGIGCEGFATSTRHRRSATSRWRCRLERAALPFLRPIHVLSQCLGSNI